MFLAAFTAAAVYIILISVRRNYPVPAMEQQDKQFLTLPDGTKLAYYFIAAQAVKKPYPVIFLQGGPGGFISKRNIELLRPLAADGFDVYLYDQIGGGASSRLDDINQYTPERHVQDLLAMVQQTGAGKAILMGQSWGCMLAALFTARYPDKVDRIIFASPGPIPPLRKASARVKAPDSLQLRMPLYSNAQAVAAASNARTRFTAFWARNFGRKWMPDEEADNFQTYMTMGTNKSVVCDTALAPAVKSGGGYYVQLMTMQHLQQVSDPRPALKQCPIPVLVLKGQCDNQPWAYTAEYLECFHNHQFLYIRDAGHSISIEQKAAFLQGVRSFLLYGVQ